MTLRNVSFSELGAASTEMFSSIANSDSYFPKNQNIRPESAIA